MLFFWHNFYITFILKRLILMKIAYKIFLIALLGISVSNCENDSEDDLVDIDDPSNEITYTTNIKIIIDDNCIGCHNNPPINGAPMPLLSYQNVVDAVNNRGLLNRISSEDTNFLMPLGGPRLPQATIDQVKQWIDEGLKE